MRLTWITRGFFNLPPLLAILAGEVIEAEVQKTSTERAIEQMIAADLTYQLPSQVRKKYLEQEAQKKLKGFKGLALFWRARKVHILKRKRWWKLLRIGLEFLYVLIVSYITYSLIFPFFWASGSIQTLQKESLGSRSKAPPPEESRSTTSSQDRAAPVTKGGGR